MYKINQKNIFNRIFARQAAYEIPIALHSTITGGEPTLSSGWHETTCATSADEAWDDCDVDPRFDSR